MRTLNLQLGRLRVSISLAGRPAKRPKGETPVVHGMPLLILGPGGDFSEGFSMDQSGHLRADLRTETAHFNAGHSEESL
jgi:hypothetical protein